MPGGRPELYPWDIWLDGEERLLIPSRDFASSAVIESLRQQIYAKARSRGQRVSVRRYGDGNIVVHAGTRPHSGRLAGGRPEAYDWDTLFNGHEHRLTQGADFPRGNVANFQVSIRRAAKRRGVRVITRQLGQGGVSLQMVGDALIYEAATEKELISLPLLIDPGVEEDTEFEQVEWDGWNALVP